MKARGGSSYFRSATGSHWEIFSGNVGWCFQGDISKLTGTVLLGMDKEQEGEWEDRVGGAGKIQVRDHGTVDQRGGRGHKEK